ncbi:cupin domain-containing protein [Sphaerisporangium album]|uniref:Cupin domain-containing protein n=1 Tax=Sphaerisporangium album TaxID=509200 RepID=A0A367FNZ0_9ACTN|nr:cupin domain-containing protein [Sphaerisporangium album]RCG31619.1 cupin domain-containing protein [Sphaerisporangium album]
MTVLFHPPGAGTRYPFLGTTMTVKAGERDTGAALSVIESECPPGFATPRHVHHHDDEAFYVLSGAVQVHCEDEAWEAGPGGFILLPRGRPHAFVNRGDEALRMLQLTWPAGFEHFTAEVSALPAGPPDFALLAEIGARHGYEILGPPPA